ncbi:hypothetical protein ACNRBV_04070 [Ralstonia pseudosolanacearum]|uniref:hypothetical protein n=1 Tax=Ralstonia pseudosolanacearum TaxID=1310165 RepID=UPI0018A405B3|nr:hypothetical protein [Ralstonia pseudosolanacearum]BCL93379.1 hypothetical protein MAFF211479_30800 [Ralstonia solanacearum]BCN05946.1 hypothetical protein RPSB_30830 [Ralstonia solanacearum]
MMDWISLHRQSEKFARQAHEKLGAGDDIGAKRAFAEAAKLEAQALDLLDVNKERTRGVAAVSATSLWYKAGELGVAAQFAYRQLGVGGLPDFAQEQLEELLRAIYDEREKSKYQANFLPGKVSVSVKGGEVLHGAAPLDLIVDRVKTIQAMFYRVLEWETKRPHRRSGPPPKEIASKFEPWLLQEAPGSFQFSVAVKTNPQLQLFADDSAVEARDVAERFLNIVQTVITDDSGEMTKMLIPEDDYRSTFRKLVRNLTPTGGSFESLELQVPGLVEAPRMDAASRTRISNVVRSEQPKPDASAGEAAVEITGHLRALDLNRDWLKVQTDEGGDVTVKGLSQTVDDVIGPMVNKRVLVRALKPQAGALRFLDIELTADAPRK